MSIDARGCALALGVIAAIVASPAAADTIVATKWRLLGEAQNSCLEHAWMALYRSGFDASEPGSQSMSGKRGEYAASIRCIAEQRMVFFVTAGPSSEETLRRLDMLYRLF